MPPKQDSNADRITAIEGQLGGLTSVIEEMRAEMKTNHQRSLEMKKCTEERHRQSTEEKQTGVESAVMSNPENPRSMKGSAEETQRSISYGSQPQAKGLEMRPEKGILQVTETAIPLRTTKIHSTPFTAGSSGYSAHLKGLPLQKKLELPELAHLRSTFQ